ncbi:hypothetical protein ON010_g4549 [Phytophthora cinnamomi]|nr:hypothetical protein ON010_g4549 [Phytophthora cinnamomi]
MECLNDGKSLSYDERDVAIRHVLKIWDYKLAELLLLSGDHFLNDASWSPRPHMTDEMLKLEYVQWNEERVTSVMVDLARRSHWLHRENTGAVETSQEPSSFVELRDAAATGSHINELQYLYGREVFKGGDSVNYATIFWMCKSYIDWLKWVAEHDLLVDQKAFTHAFTTAVGCGRVDILCFLKTLDAQGDCDAAGIKPSQKHLLRKIMWYTRPLKEDMQLFEQRTGLLDDTGLASTAILRPPAIPTTVSGFCFAGRDVGTRVFAGHHAYYLGGTPPVSAHAAIRGCNYTLDDGPKHHEAAGDYRGGGAGGSFGACVAVPATCHPVSSDDDDGMVGIQAVTLMTGVLANAVVSVSAHAVLINSNSIVWKTFMGLEVDSNIRVGNCLGANAPKQASTVSLLLMLGISSTFSFTPFILRGSIPSLFLNDPQGVAHAVVQGILHGAGKQKVAASLNAVAYYIFGISVASQPTGISLWHGHRGSLAGGRLLHLHFCISAVLHAVCTLDMDETRR